MIKEKELDKTFYEIQVKGYLDARWNELFDGMSIAWKDNVTTISGMVAMPVESTTGFPVRAQAASRSSQSSS